LLNNPTDPERAQKAFDLALNSTSTRFHPNQKRQLIEWLDLATQLNAAATSTGVLVLDPLPPTILNCRAQMGWLQKAIVLSYYYLLRHVEYLKPENKEQDIYFDAIKYTIKEGGDTDTNAAIVGGMIGALVGFNGI